MPLHNIVPLPPLLFTAAYKDDVSRRCTVLPVPPPPEQVLYEARELQSINVRLAADGSRAHGPKLKMRLVAGGAGPEPLAGGGNSATSALPMEASSSSGGNHAAAGLGGRLGAVGEGAAGLLEVGPGQCWPKWQAPSTSGADGGGGSGPGRKDVGGSRSTGGAGLAAAMSSMGAADTGGGQKLGMALGSSSNSSSNLSPYSETAAVAPVMKLPASGSSSRMCVGTSLPAGAAALASLRGGELLLPADVLDDSEAQGGGPLMAGAAPKPLALQGEGWGAGPLGAAEAGAVRDAGRGAGAGTGGRPPRRELQVLTRQLQLRAGRCEARLGACAGKHG